MNIQAYIESGIIEEYVLGTVSPQEKQEVECMSHIYPEIKEELLRAESALEEYALKHQTAPPASIKESLFAKLNFEGPVPQDETTEEEKIKETLSEDIREGRAVDIPVSADIDESRVISDAFATPQVSTVTPFWAKLAVAASLSLALFAGWSVTKMSDLRKTNEVLALQVDSIKTDVAYTAQLAGLYRDPRFKVVHLSGLKKSPQSSVSAFWNQQTNEVMLDIQKLPPAPAGKQYQLWSIVDEVPVDLGMLDEQFENKLLRMKNTKNGSVAFAITLEKQGGNPTPTMEEMYVMGEV
jgi:anti-sigma-K factor RskA